MLTSGQKALAQRSPVRILRKAQETRQWRTRPQGVGVRYSRQGEDPLGGRPLQAGPDLPGGVPYQTAQV